MAECNCGGNHEHSHDTEHESKVESIVLFIGIIVFIISIFMQDRVNDYFKISLFLLSYVLIGYDILFNAIKKLFRKDMFDENFLMSIATIGALFTGNYTEGIAVLLFYKIGEFLQDLAVKNSKKKIKDIIDLRPDYANLKNEDDIRKVNPVDVNIGDTIIVKNGERIPLDGVITKGETDLDVSALTGESIPRTIKQDDEVLSGSINLGALIEIKVTKNYENSTVSKIIELIEDSTSKKSNTEKFITRFAKIYTPIVTLLAVLIAIIFPVLLNIPFEDSLFRALTFLVVSCPCALVVSVPLGFFTGIGTSSKNGILIKGSNYLDMLSNAKQFIFDKTGTLTTGKFKIKNIVSNGDMSQDEILEYVSISEVYSNHYIAKAIVNSYNKTIDKSRITAHEEISGNGIKTIIDSKEILVGNIELMRKNNISIENFENIGNSTTVVLLSINGKFEGYITLEDEIKKDSLNIANELRNIGATKIIMLTGDNKIIANKISSKLQFDKVYAELLPVDKVDIMNQEKLNLNKNEYQVFVGDGINDAPILAASDIGISMGKGSDIAIETSDIVLMTDEPSKLIDAIKISKKTKYIVKQNIIFALIVKVAFLIFSGMGILTMWFAIFADVGVSLIAIVNCMRIFNYKNKKNN